MTTDNIEQPRIVPRDEWLAARKQRLVREKELTRLRDQLNAERRQLPWVKVEKNSIFDTCDGKESLSDLFDGRRGKGYYNYELIAPGFDELPGISVFFKDENGDVFHTYSSHARGGDILLGAHNYLDLTPKGRNESGTMDWVRHHDRYGDEKESTDVA